MTETFPKHCKTKKMQEIISVNIQDHYFTGDTYVLWDLTNVRIDLGMKEGENAITLGGFGNTVNDVGMGRIYGSSISNGIKRLQFEGDYHFHRIQHILKVQVKIKQVVLKGIKVFINDELN